MTLLMLLEMVASAFGDRVAVGTRAGGLTYQQLLDRAGAGAEVLRRRGAAHLAYVGRQRRRLPRRPCSPPPGPACRSSRSTTAWATSSSRALLANHDDVAASSPTTPSAVPGDGRHRAARRRVERAPTRRAGRAPSRRTTDGEDIAVLLYTSGTTAAPKAVVLRHRHLTSYVIDVGRVRRGRRRTTATLVSVPPYHIAGVANAVSNVYAGRRIVYLPAFTPEAWLGTVRAEGITHAMVVPTMLARVVEHLGDAAGRLPHAALAGLRRRPHAGDGARAGAGRVPRRRLRQRLRPHRDQLDHRRARARRPPGRAGRRRRWPGRGSASVGRLVPGIEVEVRDGEIWVRGEQVSGEYLGTAAAVDGDGWFPTRDRGWVDDEGYLFIEGRSDDTIIRGGENIAPAEIEDVLLAHPDVLEAAVVGPARRGVGPAARRRRGAAPGRAASTRTSCGPTPASGCGRPRPPT